MKKTRHKMGFTLVETLVALGIFVIIGFAVTSFNKDIFFLNSSVQSDLNTQLDSRKILRNFVKEIRGATPSSVGSYPLAQVATSSIIFYGDIDSDQEKERLRYFLDSGELKRGVLEPTGSPLSYDPLDEDVQTIIRNVTNTTTPIFDYFGETFAGTTSALAIPVDPSLVRLIRITVIIDEDSNRPPISYTATSQGTLRNLKGK